MCPRGGGGVRDAIHAPQRRGDLRDAIHAPQRRGDVRDAIHAPQMRGTCEMHSMRDAHTRTVHAPHTFLDYWQHSLLRGFIVQRSMREVWVRCVGGCPCGDGMCGLSASRVGSGRPGKYVSRDACMSQMCNAPSGDQLAIRRCCCPTALHCRHPLG